MSFVRYVPAVVLAALTAPALATGGPLTPNAIDNSCGSPCSVNIPDGPGHFILEWDSDCDGWLDGDDNCPIDPNATQTDTDLDSDGDACDLDDDGDGVADASDLCPAEMEDGLAPDPADGCAIACPTTTFDDVHAGTPDPVGGAAPFGQASDNWQFGYLSGGAFVASTNYRDVITGNTDIMSWQKGSFQATRPRVATNDGAALTFARNVYPTTGVQMQPGSANEAAVMFVVTEEGQHDIDATFTSGRSLTGAVDAVASVWINGTLVDSGSVMGFYGTGTDFVFSALDEYLYVGDEVVFALSRNGAGDVTDTTLLDATVVGSCAP